MSQTINLVYAASYKSFFLINYLINTKNSVSVISSNLAIINYCMEKKIPIHVISYKKISLIKHPLKYKKELKRVFNQINPGVILWFTHNNHDSFGFALMRLYSKSGGTVNWLDLDPKIEPIKLQSLLFELAIDFPRIIRVIFNIALFRIIFDLHSSPSRLGIPKKISLALLSKMNTRNNFYSMQNLKNEVQVINTNQDDARNKNSSVCILVWAMEDFHRQFISSSIFNELLIILSSKFDIVEFKSHPQYPIVIHNEGIVNLPSFIPAIDFMDKNKVVIGLSSVTLVEAIVFGCKNVFSLLDIFPDIPSQILIDQKNFLMSEMRENKAEGIIFLEDFDQLKDSCNKILI